jgi:hypothetical protein
MAGVHRNQRPEIVAYKIGTAIGAFRKEHCPNIAPIQLNSIAVTSGRFNREPIRF